MAEQAAVPHQSASARTVRTGGFFLPGDVQDSDGGAWQLGPSWVQWEAPPEGTAKKPWVFVHGGGGQSTDWLGVSSEAPGWAPQVVEAGFPAYLLDRPGHGRSPYDPDRLGARTGFPDYAGAAKVFVPEGTTAANTAWTWGRAPGAAELDALVASSAGMLLDTALGQELDARRIVDLLRRTGTAVLATHSAGAAGGWLAAARSPERVRAVISVEPIGPPFQDLGPRGRLEHGVAAVPFPSGSGRKPLDGLPVLVVSGEASGRAGNDAETVSFLERAGAHASHLHLGAAGIGGNGHGLIFESNTQAVLEPVLEWLAGINLS
ncbi:alpha/beta fold hydrolase [Arthrobacter sp. GCM10027362]|uniref:alpha/beta fold hydrolase n=1 Tax=Arthrobacter sp. GCM10027362 TaxID=3273379 RepID=UPI00363979C8